MDGWMDVGRSVGREERMKRSRVKRGGSEDADGGVEGGAGLKVKTRCAEWWGFTGRSVEMPVAEKDYGS